MPAHTSSSNQTHGFPAPSDRRPSSFLGAALEIGEMDPELMIGSAGLGMFVDPEYQGWRDEIAQYESDHGVEEDLMLRRTTRQREVDTGASAEVVEVSETGVGEGESWGQGEQLQGRENGKRRFSRLLREGILEFGRAVRKRTDSWAGWRRPSGERVLLLGARGDVDSCSYLALAGSGEQSRDADDELSAEEGGGGEELPPYAGVRHSSMQFDALLPSQVGESVMSRPVRRSSGAQARNREAQPVPVESAVERLERLHQTLVSSTHIPVPKTYAPVSQFLGANSSRKMAIMERQVRIAERDGAFSEEQRTKLFKGTYLHRCTEREQARASVKLKEEVARKKRKSAKLFEQRLAEQSMPLKGVWDRVRRWSRGETEVVEEAGARSEVAVFPESSGYASGSSSSVDSRESQRGGTVAETARQVGFVFQSAPRIF